MENPREWTGGCLCGRRRYRFRQDPSSVGYCHCSMCRRATGGPFALLVRVAGADLRWENERPATFRSSPIAVRGFCPDCGTPLFLQYDDDDRIRLMIGSLDHPERVRPSYHYGVESRIPWIDCSPGLRESETREQF